MGERRCCRKSLHGCGAFALSVSEAAALTRLAGAVVGGKMNTIAADDFQHSSHFAGGGQNPMGFDAAGALANLSTDSGVGC